MVLLITAGLAAAGIYGARKVITANLPGLHRVTVILGVPFYIRVLSSSNRTVTTCRRRECWRKLLLRPAELLLNLLRFAHRFRWLGGNKPKKLRRYLTEMTLLHI